MTLNWTNPPWTGKNKIKSNNSILNKNSTQIIIQGKYIAK